jgi:hypothetical protein
MCMPPAPPRQFTAPVGRTGPRRAPVTPGIRRPHRGGDAVRAGLLLALCACASGRFSRSRVHRLVRLSTEPCPPGCFVPAAQGCRRPTRRARDELLRCARDGDATRTARLGNAAHLGLLALGEKAGHMAAGVLRGLDMCDAALDDPTLGRRGAVHACLVAAPAYAAESTAAELAPADLLRCFAPRTARLVALALGGLTWAPWP